MIPADAHTKILERRIHNQRVQLAWWAENASTKGWRHFRRLHDAVMGSYRKTNARRLKMRAALQDISDMEGEEGMDDHIFAEKALALANDALGSPSGTIPEPPKDG
jgi:hypothetical protein